MHEHHENSRNRARNGLGGNTPVRYFIDPELYAPLLTMAGTIGASAVAGYFSYRSSKASKEAGDTVEHLNERNEERALKRELDERAEQKKNSDRDKLLLSAIRALHREGIGNGELQDAINKFTDDL